MALRRGDLILGRFEIEGPLRSWGELRRFAARDTATGAAVAVHQPAAEVRIRPGAAERFRTATTRRPERPALSQPLAAGEHEGAPVAAYPMSSSWTEHAPLTDDALLQLAAWLAAAMTAAPDALGGALRPEDVVLLPDGVPMLQPTGVQPRHSRAVPTPHLAPGDGTPLDGALYGLGLLLFEAAAGQTPFSPETVTDLLRQQQHPPRLRDIRPDISDELDALTGALMSPEPANRRGALSRLRADASPHVGVKQAATAPIAPVAQEIVATRAPTQAGARRDVPLDAWVVTADLTRTPETLRRRLAALSGFSDVALARAAREGLPVPVGSARSEAEARSIAERLGAASVPLSVQPSSKQSRALLAAGLLAALLGVGLLVAGSGAAAIGLSPLLAILVLALGGLLIGGGGITAGVAALRSGVPRALRAGHLLLSEGHPEDSPLVARMQDARRALLTSELSEPARIDLLSAVDALQEALPAIDRDEERQRVAAAVEDIISAAGAAGLQGADAAAVAEEASLRARAARTAARELR
ncbi:MAG: hypothetical protein ACI8S6_003329 [Myxococcota bacterium]|jgi:hypothetical protein